MSSKIRDRRHSTGGLINKGETRPTSLENAIDALEAWKRISSLEASRPAPPPPIKRALSSRSLNIPRDKGPSRVSKGRKPEESTSKNTREAVKNGMLHVLKDANISVIAQAVDFDTLSDYPFEGVLLNPFLLLRGTRLPDVQYHIWAAVEYVLAECTNHNDVDRLLNLVMERYRVELGVAMMERVKGPHYTFVDTNLHNDRDAIVAQAVRLIALFEKHEVERGKIIVSIPATDDGLRAARQLEAEEAIRTNLILVSSLAHASVCVEAGASSLSFCQDTLVQAHDALATYGPKRSMANKARIRQDACVAAAETIQAAAAYCRLHNAKTKVMVTNAKMKELRLLRDIDGLCLRQSELKRAKSTTLEMLPSPDAASTIHRRAQQADFPTTYLSCKEDFLAAMPLEMQILAMTTLSNGLRSMTFDLEATSEIVRAELEHRLFINSMDDNQLSELYVDDLRRHLDYEGQVEEAEAEGLPTHNIPQPEPKARMTHIGFRLFWLNWDEPQMPDSEYNSRDGLDEEASQVAYGILENAACNEADDANVLSSDQAARSLRGNQTAGIIAFPKLP